jgi:nucleoside-diphosphate-sugar epimerase
MTVAGAKNLVFFSSIAVYGRREGLVTEADEGAPPFDAYAGGKRRCETIFRAWSEAAPGRRVIALRPGIVYGAGSPLWIDKMAQRITSGAWGLFGERGKGLAALIHVDDLARQALVASRLLDGAGRDGLPPFVALNAVGPESLEWNDYFQALAGALGLSPLEDRPELATGFRQALAALAKIARRLGLDIFPTAALAPGPGELALFSLRAKYSGENAARLLQFSPATRLREGLALCRLDQASR